MAPAQRVLILLSKLFDRLLYGGYRAELDSAADDIVARYSRGSIALQLKRFMMPDDTEALHEAGDKAAKRLAKRVGGARR